MLDRFRKPPPDRAAVEQLITAAEDAVMDGDPQRALGIAGRALRAAETVGIDELIAGALVIRSDAHQEFGDLSAACRDAERAVTVHGASADAWCRLAEVRHHLGDPTGAVEACERAVQLDPRNPYTWEQMGRALQWIDLGRADVAFGRAAAIAPELVFAPVRVTAAEFDRMAQRAWEALPDELAAMLANVIAAVEPLPAIEEVREGLDPDILGLYEGATALYDDGAPERILLFQHNLETASRDRAQLIEEVRRTVVHEVGHHLGMDHGELPF